MAWYLGIDTSNYTTSAALYNGETGEVLQRKMLLPVKEGALGLRQSDAVFSHVKQLGGLVEALMADSAEKPVGIGVSTRPRNVEGSYMPCFLAGEMAARTAAAILRVPLTTVSHQAGHIAAALYSAGRLDFIGRPFIAFHLSGGTTECLLVRPRQGAPFSVELYSKSLDLKAGQVVDRVGAMLSLPFPAGNALEALAEQSEAGFRGKPAFHGNDCCLSGVENQCAAMCERGEAPADVARFCLSMIMEAVLEMTNRVKKEYDWPVVYAGGVMSNRMIRRKVEKVHGGYFAEPAFSSDNAAGVAILAHRSQEAAG